MFPINLNQAGDGLDGPILIATGHAMLYILISSQTNLLLTTISFRLGARDILSRFGRKGAWDDGPGEF